MQSSSIRIVMWVVGAALLIGLILTFRSSGQETAATDGVAAQVAAMRQDRNMEGLGEMATGSDASGARRALDALSGFGAAAVPQIRPALADRRPEVRTRAAAAVGLAGDPEHGRLLAEHRRSDTSVDVRRAAASAIGRLNGYPQMDLLTDAMIKD
ncbi:MAG: HEAT repeat domain-containing protein, partial [Phycisphaeraceae bacterium]|nr:HEAT repeat domain-containing protein [Phycisphaeraceae bacterium]